MLGPEVLFVGPAILGDLKLRHNLDVMHIEKNIRENLLGTFLNIEGRQRTWLVLGLIWRTWA